VLLLRQEVQDDGVESFRGFHIGHMPHARHHHAAGSGDTLLETLRNGMTIRDIALTKKDKRGHPDGVEPLRGWWGQLTERIRMDPVPARILRNNLHQAGSCLRVFQRRSEERAIESDVPPRLDARVFGPRTDGVL
jgi:hypothetical protein